MIAIKRALKEQETEKAYLFSIDCVYTGLDDKVTTELQPIWVPKSQCIWKEADRKLWVAEWVIRQKEDQLRHDCAAEDLVIARA